MTPHQQYFSGVPLATLQQNRARNAFMAHPENVVLAIRLTRLALFVEDLRKNSSNWCILGR